MSLVLLLRSRMMNRVKRKVFIDRGNPFEIEDHEFFCRYRFPKECVFFLIDILTEDLETETVRSKAIPPYLIVTTSLSMMGSGCFQATTGQVKFHKLQQPTVSRIFSRFLKALYKHIAEYIKFPKTESEIVKTKLGFLRQFGFPSVIGAIDGIHFEIQKPSLWDAHTFCNRKGVYSINVQAICDSNHIFTDVVCRWPGSTPDSNIYKTSSIFNHLHGPNLIANSYLLGDSEYPLEHCLLTPVPNPQTPQEKRYNDIHNKARRVIDLSFGILKGRFPILNKLTYRIEKCVEIIICCFMLNNYAILNNIPVPGEFIVEVSEDESGNEIQLETQLGTVIREQLINYNFKRSN